MNGAFIRIQYKEKRFGFQKVMFLMREKTKEKK